MQGDIAKGDESALTEPFAEARPEAVIHLAAEIASQRDQRKVLAANVDGTRRVVVAANECGTRPKLVFCSTVVTGDATDMPFGAGAFTAVVCFTMLHHLPSAAAQDQMFAEAARVLRPGGVFAGVDSLRSLRFRLIHLADTCTPVDPATLPDRLAAAGFQGATVQDDGRRLWFRAYAPGGQG